MFRGILLGLFFIMEDVFAHNIGNVAERLTIGADIVTQVMLGVCLVMGVGLIALAVVHYKGHRHNPKLIPLGKPVMYLVMGLILLCVPFMEEYLGDTGRSLLEKDKKQKANPTVIHDIDAPLVPDDWVNDYDH